LYLIPGTLAQKNEWATIDGGNGHFYEAVLVPEGITWIKANSDAKAMGGYLATITCEEENEFVYNLISNDDRFWIYGAEGYVVGPWLGGFQDPNKINPSISALYDNRKGADTGWTWVTGEPFLFTKWANAYNQPDNIGISESKGNFEDRLVFLGKMRKESTWNDLASTCKGYSGPCSDKTNGFIVEFKKADYGIHAATSWWDGEKEHIRVYTQGADGKPKEYCWDGNGWYLGGFTDIADVNPIVATSWWDGEKEHIRVYTKGANGKPKEYCWDNNSWYIGGFTEYLS
jgi:ribosome modulation factor